MTRMTIFKISAAIMLVISMIACQSDQPEEGTEEFQLEAKIAKNSGTAASDSSMTEAIVPIVALKAGCLLGGTMGGQWLDAEKAAPLIKGDSRYRFYMLDGPAGEGHGDKPSSIGAPCEDSLEIPFPLIPNKEGIAIGGAWNAMPRIPTITDTLQKVYRDAAADILKKNGIKNPRVVLTQVLRIDLDGDGMEEVLVSATNYAGGLQPGSKAGDYSMVFLRKIIAGRVETMIIAAEYYPTAKEFNAPNQYEVTAIADADGNGVMEILIYGHYYEGHFSSLFRLDKNKLQEMLSCGCGA